MAEESRNKKFNIYLTIVLAIVIIVAIGIYAYITFIPKESPESNNNTTPITDDSLLTISVGSQIYNYTLDDLTVFDAVSGQGMYINQKGKITGPNNYTGVAVLQLLSSIQSLPTNYTIHAFAPDGYNISYSIDEVNGHVPVLNETGFETATGNLTMIIAYQENGAFMNETTKGPLRIAFISTVPTLTNSGLWLSYLAEIQINES